MRKYRIWAVEYVENYYELEVEDKIDINTLKDTLWEYLAVCDPLETESKGMELDRIEEMTGD